MELKKDAGNEPRKRAHLLRRLRWGPMAALLAASLVASMC